MNDKMGKLFAKKAKDKKGSMMGDTEREAKMSVLKHVGDMASDMMKGRLDGLKKVTVASDSASGLKEGLAKAKDMLAAKEEGMEEEASGDEEGAEHEAMESPEYEAAEHGEKMMSHDGLEMDPIRAKKLEIEPMEEGEDMDESELDAKLQRLMKLKERMSAKKRM